MLFCQMSKEVDVFSSLLPCFPPPFTRYSLCGYSVWGFFFLGVGVAGEGWGMGGILCNHMSFRYSFSVLIITSTKCENRLAGLLHYRLTND